MQHTFAVALTVTLPARCSSCKATITSDDEVGVVYHNPFVKPPWSAICRACQCRQQLVLHQEKLPTCAQSV